MTTNANPENQVEDQEREDAWAYRALGIPLPGEPQGNGRNGASSQNSGENDGDHQENAGEPFRTQASSRPPANNGRQPVSPSITPPGEPPVGDPLSALTLDDLLKHPALGPQLNSWNDRSVNTRVEQYRDRWRQEETPRILATQQFEEDRAYLESLNDQERGQVLASDPGLANTWAQSVALRQQQQTQQVNPAAIAASAQVYALATQIQMFDRLIDESSLPDTAKLTLKNTKDFEGKGVDGLTDWGKRVQSELIRHETEAAIQKEIEARWESYLEDNKASNPSGRPRPSSVPGRRAAPLPDVRDAKSEEFLSAFN